MKKYKVSEEFILEAHKASCSEWKQKLEKEFPEVFESKIEVGKWYKVRGGCLFYLSSFDSGKNKGYGFDSSGDWNDNRGTAYYFGYKSDIIREAKGKEVEEALVSEAKKRYNVGDKLSKIYDDSSRGDRIFSHELTSDHWRNCLWIDNDHGYSSCIFKDGKWAEIIDDKSELKEEIKSLEEKLKELRSKL